ncbi:MAG: hypothetical protein ACHP7O_11110, partial [Burkholderiales bacterium]
MKILPRTLFGQIFLALCVGLIAAQAAGFWLTLNDRTRFGEGLLGAFAAQRIAGVISILDQAEPGDRGRLVHALSVPPTHVSLDEPWGTAVEPNAEDAKAFIQRVEQELDRPVVMQVLSIKRAEIHRHEINENINPANPVATDPAHRARHATHPVLFVVGQARLADGAVVTFRHSLPEPVLDWPIRLFGLLVILGVSVALLSGWTVRRLTRPLASLAAAATGLARNLER